MKAEDAFMLSRLSVSITYPFLLLALVVGVGFLFGGLGVTGTERTSRDLLDRLTDETTERVRLAIRTNLDAPYKLSNLNASLIRNGSMNLDDLRALIPSLQSQLDTYPGISAVLVSNAALDTIWVERRGSGQHVVAISDGQTPPNTCVEWHIDDAGIIVGDPIGRYEYRPESRPWFKAAVDSPIGSAWCPIYPWATSDGSSNPIGTGYSVNVRDESGRSMAVVDVGFTVESISNYLSGIQVATNGHVFIMNQDGNLVATDRPDAPSSLQGRLVPAIHSSNPLVAHAAETLADEDSTYLDDKGFTHAEFTEHDGALYLVDMNALDVSWAPDWRIVTVIPEDDLLVQVREVQDRLLFWGVVVLGVAAVLGILLALSIARPIIGLQRAAAGITGGDFDVQFPGGGGREFAQLARELDSMCLGLKERLELRTSLEVAMEVQQHLLPTGVPASELLDIAAFSTYCDETGGDYYDFPEASNVEAVDDGSLLVAIGDVTGHGIAAALIMATARASLRTRLRQRGSIGDVLSDVNEIMVTDSPDGKFMTFLAVLVAPDASGFKWTSAGHDPPILLDGATGEFSEPEGGGIPLGILADQEYPEYVCPIGPSGSIVLTGTDGIWETASPDKELYGKERLCEVIRAHAEEDARSIGDAIIADLNAFRGSNRPLDDVTMVILKRK